MCGVIDNVMNGITHAIDSAASSTDNVGVAIDSQLEHDRNVAGTQQVRDIMEGATKTVIVVGAAYGGYAAATAGAGSTAGATAAEAGAGASTGAATASAGVSEGVTATQALNATKAAYQTVMTAKALNAALEPKPAPPPRSGAPAISYMPVAPLANPAGSKKGAPSAGGGMSAAGLDSGDKGASQWAIPLAIAAALAIKFL